jgi:hypothetical protein
MNYWDCVKKRSGIDHACLMWTEHGRFTSPPQEYGRRSGHTEYMLVTFKMPTLTEAAAHYFVPGPLLPLALWCLQRQTLASSASLRRRGTGQCPALLFCEHGQLGAAGRQLYLGYHLTKLRRGQATATPTTSYRGSPSHGALRRCRSQCVSFWSRLRRALFTDHTQYREEDRDTR